MTSRLELHLYFALAIPRWMQACITFDQGLERDENDPVRMNEHRNVLRVYENPCRELMNLVSDNNVQRSNAHFVLAMIRRRLSETLLFYAEDLASMNFQDEEIIQGCSFTLKDLRALYVQQGTIVFSYDFNDLSCVKALKTRIQRYLINEVVLRLQDIEVNSAFNCIETAYQRELLKYQRSIINFRREQCPFLKNTDLYQESTMYMMLIQRRWKGSPETGRGQFEDQEYNFLRHFQLEFQSDRDAMSQYEEIKSARDAMLRETMINSYFPARRANSGEHILDSCPICLEHVDAGSLNFWSHAYPSSGSGCNSRFHEACFRGWMRDHSRCPGCRGEVRARNDSLMP